MESTYKNEKLSKWQLKIPENNIICWRCRNFEKNLFCVGELTINRAILCRFSDLVFLLSTVNLPVFTAILSSPVAFVKVPREVLRNCAKCVTIIFDGACEQPLTPPIP